MTPPAGEPLPIDYGLSTTLLQQLSLEQALERIAGIGIGWVEACATRVHLDPRANPNIPSIRAACARFSIQVRSVHLPFMGVYTSSADPARRESSLDLHSACLQHAAELGATVAVMHSAGMASSLSQVQEAEAKKLSQQFVADLVRVARPLGMRIAVENELIGYAPPWALSMTGLAPTFSDPEIGFCLDTGHAVAADLDCLREIEAAGDRLIATHLNSNEGYGDPHMLPTRGKLPWPQVKAALLARFHGLWTLEIKGGDSTDAVLADIARFVRTP